MKIDQQDFNDMVALAMQDAEVALMRPVIEKELLHYDMLYCLDQGGLLDDVVFQGGTSLRLCYGGNRFSEDLAFAGGRDFSSKQLTEMKACIEHYIGSRYGLTVTVKEPKSLRQEAKYAELKVDKWQISVVTAEQRRDLPQQRIKIEVANIPAYTKKPRSLIKNYDFLPDGYDDTLIYTETLDEVMADKLVSLPATQKYIRHRDVWDLAWLVQQKATLIPDLVQKKIADYRLDDFTDMLARRHDSISEIVHSESFEAEMLRFLPSNVYDRTLGKEKFKDHLASTLSGLLSDLQRSLEGPTEDEGEFVM